MAVTNRPACRGGVVQRGVVQRVGRRARDQEDAGSRLRNDCGQVVHTHSPLSSSSM